MEAITTKIRPAARLISTIGEDLIGDVYSAIVELVKNSYDADASKIDIVFNYITIDDEPALKIEIEDDGHGMTTDTVLNAWLVPATKDKLDRHSSPTGRLFQGKKGIGRYAAAILGQEMVLRTVSQDHEQTEVYINWSHFEVAEFLSDVDILVTSEPTTKNAGTGLYISARQEKLTQWGMAELAALTQELRKLKSPLKNQSDENFKITLAFVNSPFPTYNDLIFEIDSFPIIDLYDYRISGNITDSGFVTALYENKTTENLPNDLISVEILLGQNASYCGPIDFDIRVFDRDSESIVNLINKGLIDPISKLAVGKREARRLLDDIYGVNIYREGFRIRPYGNGGIDWLNLDRDRIQNPSLRISNNQVVGFINIKPEKISHLEEKSARDGLKEDSHYQGLVQMMKHVINEIEYRRFNHRQVGIKEKERENINKDLANLFDYTALTKQISERLKHLNIDDEKISEIAALILKSAEQKAKLLENIQNTIAIYQGQATLGKIVTVLLHEGRKPVHYFKNQATNLARWLTHYKAERKWENTLYEDILDRLQNFKVQSEILSGLFKRLDPLSKQNRGEIAQYNLCKTIEKSIDIFINSLKDANIEISTNCNKSISYLGWEEDLIIVFTNLIENSLYWLPIGSAVSKKISIDVIENDFEILIHYRDNGPGIDKASIEAGSIFEPGFSKKINGTGLGLPIAGESIERLNGSISAQYSTDGAYFIIEIKKPKQ